MELALSSWSSFPVDECTVRHGLSVPHCNVQIKTNAFTFNQQNEEERIGGWCVSEPDPVLFLWISVSNTEVMPAFLQLHWDRCSAVQHLFVSLASSTVGQYSWEQLL